MVDGGTRLIEDLKVGDRVWSIGEDGKTFIEDEIILMMDNGPNKTSNLVNIDIKSIDYLLIFLALFYTITTIDGDHVTLTDHHFLPVYDPEEKQFTTIRAFDVTFSHLLVVYNRTVKITNISRNFHVGYYAPLTYTGYLLVGNISASAYVYRFFTIFFS